MLTTRLLEFPVHQIDNKMMELPSIAILDLLSITSVIIALVLFFRTPASRKTPHFRNIFALLAIFLLAYIGFMVLESIGIRHDVEQLENYTGAILPILWLFLLYSLSQNVMLRDLAEKERRIEDVLDATHDGIWDWNLLTGQVNLSPHWYEMLGYAPHEIPGDHQFLRKFFHPDDLKKTEAKIQREIQSADHFEVESRMRTKEGGWKWIMSRGKVAERDAAGQAVRLVGTNVDIQHLKEVQTALAESEALSTAIFNQAFNFFGLLDLEGRLLRINSSVKKVLLEDANLPIGKFFWEAPWWPDNTAAKRMCEEAIKTACQGKVYRREVRHLDKNGREIVVDLSFSPFKDESGNIIYIIPESRDITEIRESRKALEESERRFRSIFDNAPYAIVINSLEDGRFLDVNEAFLKSKKMSREQALATPPSIMSMFSQEKLDALFKQIQEEGVFNEEAQTLNPDGSTSYVLFSTVKIPYGENQAILSMVVDITEEKNAALALAESEKKYREIFNNTPVGVFRTTEKGHLLEANPKLSEMFGFETPEEMLENVNNLASDIYLVAEDRKTFLQALANSPEGTSVELEFKRKDNVPLYTIIHATLKSDSMGGPPYIDGTMEDISERKRAELALRASEKKFSELFMLSPDPIVISNTETEKIHEVNESFLHLFGYSRDEVIGKSGSELGLYANEAQGEDFIANIRKNIPLRGLEIEFTCKDGRNLILSLSFKRLTLDGLPMLMVIGRDVTDQKHMQQMMIQTEKMVSLGGIAAGIAHEINNPLGIVLQAVQNLAQRSRPDFKKNIQVASEIGLDLQLLDMYMRQRQMDQFILDIKEAALRASGIVRHMLNFSRKSESRRTICDLRAILDKAVQLAKNDYDLKKHYDFKRIEIIRDYEVDIPPVNCTETEMEQVFLNLLRNGAQALMSQKTPAQSPQIILRILSSPKKLRVEIEDNGPGIPEHQLHRIFEPFFTTKQPNVGTGLGLSVSFFIITNGHNGEISVKSEVGKGTTFVIELPTLEQGDTHDEPSSNSYS